MSKFFQSSIVVLLVAALTLVSGLANGVVSAQEGQEIDPNTPMSEDGFLPMPEAIGERTSAPERGTGKKLAEPYRIPQEHLDAPSLDGGIYSESVIGVDSRVKVTSTTAYPNRAIAYLYIVFPNNSAGSCTGWLIGRRAVATAGHCVYNKSAGGWAKSITIYPGANGSYAPYGYAVKVGLWSVSGWVTSNNWEYDYGAIKTSYLKGTTTYPGNRVGWFGFRWQSSNTFSGTYTVRGYPGDKPYRTLWTMNGYVYTLGYARKLWYKMDTYGGQSGSPIYHIFNSTCCYGVGIHAYGASTIGGVQYNSGTRITQGVYTNLYNWKNSP